MTRREKMTESEGIGRRERKKLMLREALIKASYELFSVKGFDETRVEDITEKVDVSTRTFFRYFASKEDVILDYQREEHDDLVAALRQRPPMEPALTALRHAAVAVVKGCETGSYGFDADGYMTLQNLIRGHPSVRAKSIQHAQEYHASIATLIGERMGVDPDEDIRPRIVVGVLEYAHNSAYDVWKRQRKTSILYSEILDNVFQLIENGLNYPTKHQNAA